MKVAILTAVWQRPLIWAIWLQHHFPIFSALDHDFTIYVAGNEIEHKQHLEKFSKAYGISVVWVEVENHPVSRKFNKAAKRAFSKGYDQYCIIGSDDLMTKGYIETALLNAPICGTREAPVVKINTDCSTYSTVREIVHQNTPISYFGPGKLPLLGSARFLSQVVMQGLKGSLYDRIMNSGLDAALDRRLFALHREISLIPMSFEDDTVVFVLKHGENINNWVWFQHLEKLSVPDQNIRKLELLIRSAKAFYVEPKIVKQDA
ncbi:hypothetical protein [Croceimicrobium hydrocarbonivorans]|uniref:Glycosyltransferase 2-like domain-containing protein n=1 Tax=Croceimicrobium hydrocarbonivorans TaxID=2761580 RepID=A0A7H0VB82_9FLAO|nr:hypothetical protein [Croceimicrobium hydrocarbonivorans]QNR22980.1 hypothetical protein H4K34_11380 [Croceimicrobium hydrocarbonivorans]